MSLRNAAQQALEALKAHQPIGYCLNGRNQKSSLFSDDPMKLSRDTAAIAALEAALAEPRPEIEQLKAERDALKAAAEKGTEYVLAHINQDLKAERDALLAALRDAKEYARNPDYDWDSKFWRDVSALIAAIDTAREVKP